MRAQPGPRALISTVPRQHRLLDLLQRAVSGTVGSRDAPLVLVVKPVPLEPLDLAATGQPRVPDDHVPHRPQQDFAADPPQPRRHLERPMPQVCDTCRIRAGDRLPPGPALLTLNPAAALLSSADMSSPSSLMPSTPATAG